MRGLAHIFRFFLSDLVLQVADVSFFGEPDSNSGLADLCLVQLVLEDGDDAQLELIDGTLT